MVGFDVLRRSGATCDSSFAIIATTAGYAILCLAILLTNEPWKGGEEGISFVVLINAVSFPSGVIASLLLDAMSRLAAGTSLEWITARSPFWWLFLFVGCSALGYIQWFMILPRITRRLCNRVPTQR